MQHIPPNNRLIGSNTLRFVVQSIVKRETGLSSNFTVQNYMALDHTLTLNRLKKVSNPCTDGLLPC